MFFCNKKYTYLCSHQIKIAAFQELIAKGHDRVLIFEDDIRFEPFFVAKLENLLEELEERRDIWDLVFLGRAQDY